MSENHAEPPAAEQATADEPCTECVTSGEKILAGLAVLFAVFIIFMAIDMGTGGRASGFVRQRVQP